MAAVAVRRLQLVAPAETHGGAVQRIENGLRLAAPAGQRLLLIRRLPLGVLPAGASAFFWTARIEDRMRTAAAAATHGLSPGAERAAAVWFHSAAEMYAALLLAIGRGAPPQAWFWRAGAAAWDSGGSPASASRLLMTLGSTHEGVVAAARTVVALAETGHLSVIIAAIDQIRRPFVPAPSAPRAPSETGAAADLDRAVRLLARLPSAARSGIEAAVRAPSGEPLRSQWLVEAALVAAAPELAAGDGLLACTANAWLRAAPRRARGGPAFDHRSQQLRPHSRAQPARDQGLEPKRPSHAPQAHAGHVGESLAVAPTAAVEVPVALKLPARAAAAWPPRGERSAGPVPSHHSDMGNWSPEASGPRRDLPAAGMRASEHPLRTGLGCADGTAVEDRAARRLDAVAPMGAPDVAGGEQRSAVAGVFLLVGPLARLGLPAWLTVRPALAAEGFGRALLCQIAERRRAPSDDPVWMLAGEQPPAAWAGMLGAWRVGLDRWLRRRTRLRLSDVAGKHGWLLTGATGIDVRFPPDAAEVGLRRHALDLDPGWVPWLGISLRFHYRQEPLA